MASPYLPVIDVPALETLGEEIGDRGALASFLRSFVELLPGRIEAIGSLTEANALADRSQGMAATAAMVGAPRLRRRLERISSRAQSGHLPTPSEIAALGADARETGGHLCAYLRGLEARVTT